MRFLTMSKLQNDIPVYEVLFHKKFLLNKTSKMSN